MHSVLKLQVYNDAPKYTVCLAGLMPVMEHTGHIQSVLKLAAKLLDKTAQSLYNYGLCTKQSLVTWKNLKFNDSWLKYKDFHALALGTFIIQKTRFNDFTSSTMWGDVIVLWKKSSFSQSALEPISLHIHLNTKL